MKFWAKHGKIPQDRKYKTKKKYKHHLMERLTALAFQASVPFPQTHVSPTVRRGRSVKIPNTARLSAISSPPALLLIY